MFYPLCEPIFCGIYSKNDLYFQQFLSVFNYYSNSQPFVDVFKF